MKSYLSTATVGVAILIALMVAGVLWGSAVTQSGVERAVRQNFTAAGLLSRLQVEGEKMRRFEKEMFIYVAQGDRRAAYVKEFDGAYSQLLALLDEMLLPSSKVFTDDERDAVMSWKKAAAFYAAEFNQLALKADSTPPQGLSAEQRGGLTVVYNDAIKAGKDRFRELLVGTDRMRRAKEQAAQQIAVDIDATFFRLRLGVLFGGLVVVGTVLIALRGGASSAVPGTAHVASRMV
ncbi:hypothetical protein [Ideonella sp. A 288]|uniref:hypothetical protein n=1 Tax=Ideonella sp. A 288 TaxID=1962181 RepID=UPI000B4C0C9B|nr:hypothetical protein [Ideonella sp. A 288]